MSAVPAIFEIAAVMLVAPWLLGMTYPEAAILGAILGAVIPGRRGPADDRLHGPGPGHEKGSPPDSGGIVGGRRVCHRSFYGVLGHVRGR
ncbi:MAG: hypothetical protein U5R49_25575 [Deltaproteobacteria bacterium]|nr:hypothetical protein [Deltaproteobacteria bacterium]